MFDLSQSNEALARELLAHHPEGDETFDGALTQPLLYHPDTRDPARYAEICWLASQLTDSPERRATFHLERINGLRCVGGA